jgi:serine/threonine protein kinase
MFSESDSFQNQHSDYNLIRNIFNTKNIGMILDEKIKPDDYVENMINLTKTQSKSDIRKCIEKNDIDFIDFMMKIGAKLKYISSGTTGHFFRCTIYDNPNSPDKKIICRFALKVAAYVKNQRYKNVYELSRPENSEIKMLSLLSEFVLENQTTHLILPICTFYSPIYQFIKMYKTKLITPEIDKKGKFKEFVTKYEKGYFEDKVSILISELATGGDFLAFIRQNKDKLTAMHWKIFMFQIISTLAVIQNKYPSFRHNDLKANNILVDITNTDFDIDNKNLYEYMVCNKSYIIPDTGITLKIWDFDFACIPNICENIKVHENWTKRINITIAKNQYYDIHYFLRTLVSKAFFSEIITSDDIKYKELKSFINRIIPPRYYKGENVTANGRLLVNTEFTTPLKILETDKYFDCFRK